MRDGPALHRRKRVARRATYLNLSTTHHKSAITHRRETTRRRSTNVFSVSEGTVTFVTLSEVQWASQDTASEHLQ